MTQIQLLAAASLWAAGHDTQTIADALRIHQSIVASDIEAIKQGAVEIKARVA